MLYGNNKGADQPAHPQYGLHTCINIHKVSHSSTDYMSLQLSCSPVWITYTNIQKVSHQYGWLGGFVFYGPSTHFRSFRARSVNLATLFLGEPPRQFTSNKCPLTDSLNQRKGEIFSWPNLNKRMWPDWGSNQPSLDSHQYGLHVKGIKKI